MNLENLPPEILERILSQILAYEGAPSQAQVLLELGRCLGHTARRLLFKHGNISY